MTSIRALTGQADLAPPGESRWAGNGADPGWACAAALMHLPEAVLLTDATDQIRWANAAAVEMTGWAVIELCEMSLGKLLATEELDRIAKIRGALDATGLQRYHGTLVTKSGGRCEVSVSVGRSGRLDLAATIYVLRDLRRQREIEAHLLAQLAEKHELEAFKGQASGILHDLRHMSNVLGLTVKNFLRHHEDPAFRDEALRTLNEIAGQTGHLLNRMARPSAPSSLKREPTTLGKLVGRALDLLACAGHRSNVAATSVQGLDQSLACEVDTAEMLRVIFNLLLNAYEAVQRGGRVAVRGEVEADGRHVKLIVEDTGPGLTPSYLKNDLFRAFRSTKPGGIGLGLCQAKSIVEAHGGTLEAANREDGSGARVTIRVPAQLAPNDPTKEPPGDVSA